jgi:cysteine sulfinate desulfinase/cysteine desulfurase-like protein
MGDFDASSENALTGVLPNTLLISFVRPYSVGTAGGAKYRNFCNIKLKHKLMESGVIVSIGSACNTKEKGPSHVLRAIGAPFVIRCGVIRISLGDYNTMEECSRLSSILTSALFAQ